MKLSEFFAILNDFTVNKDATQLLNLSNNLEFFSSRTFANGKLSVGEDAPTAFREAINAYSKSKKIIKIRAMSLSEVEGGGIIEVNVVSARSKSVVPFSILLNNKHLIAFVE